MGDDVIDGSEGHDGCEHGHHHGHVHAPLNDLAIVGVITAVLFWPVGLVTSLIARREARARGERGEGLALVGVFISAIVGLFWSILFVAVLASGLGIGGGPFRAHGGFGFVHQGTIMRVAPGGVTSSRGQCTALAPNNSGGGTITCTNGGYVNPGGPMIPDPSSVGSTSSSSGPFIVNSGGNWIEIPGGAAGGASVGAAAGSLK